MFKVISNRGDEGGFSLVELVMVILILGLSAMLLYPSYASMIERSDKNAAISRIQGALMYGRSRAVLARRPVTLVMKIDGRKFYLEGLSKEGEKEAASGDLPSGFTFERVDHPVQRTGGVAADTEGILCGADGMVEAAMIVLHPANEEEPTLRLKVRPLTGRLEEEEQ